MLSKKQMSEEMTKVAQALPPGSARAQAYNISKRLRYMTADIATTMINDHANASHAKRHCYLLVDAGLASEENYTFKFIDGSKL